MYSCQTIYLKQSSKNPSCPSAGNKQEYVNIPDVWGCTNLSPLCPSDPTLPVLVLRSGKDPPLAAAHSVPVLLHVFSLLLFIFFCLLSVVRLPGSSPCADSLTRSLLVVLSVLCQGWSYLPPKRSRPSLPITSTFSLRQVQVSSLFKSAPYTISLLWKTHIWYLLSLTERNPKGFLLLQRKAKAKSRVRHWFCREQVQRGSAHPEHSKSSRKSGRAWLPPLPASSPVTPTVPVLFLRLFCASISKTCPKVNCFFKPFQLR